MSLTADEASDKYIELEYKYIELKKKLDEEKDYRKKAMIRRKRKLIRAEQNQLYPYMVGTGYVKYTEDLLGLSGYQILYKRTQTGKNKKK